MPAKRRPSIDPARCSNWVQGSSRRGPGDLFGALYSDPERLRTFLSAMTGFSMGSAQAIARKFPWRKVKNFCDIGGALAGC